MLFSLPCTSSRRQSVVSSGYPTPSIAVPADAPSQQTGMEAFAPSLSGTPTGSEPILSRITPIGKADRCIWIAGDQFTSAIELKVYGECSNGTSGFVSATRLKRSGNIALFALPDSIPDRAFLLAWPVDSAGVGLPLAINAPEVFSVNCDSWGSYIGVAGSLCYVGGINLSNWDTPAKSWVYLQPAVGTGQFVTATILGDDLVYFTVPSIAVGTYQVWVHNGRGGAYGWHRSRRSLVISTAADENRDFSASSVNLSTYTAIYGGGPGSGVSMVTAWNAAIADLNNVGGTVHLQSGNYVTDGELVIVAGGAKAVLAKGAGMDVTFIRPMAGYSNDPNYGLFHSNSNVNEIQDMTLDFDNGLGTVDRTVLGGHGCRRVKVKAASRNAAVNDLQASQDGIILDDCDLWGGLDGSSLVGYGELNNSIIRNCRFRQANTCEAALYVLSVSDNVLLLSSTAADYTPGVNTGKGRFATLGFRVRGVTIHDCLTDPLMVGGGDSNKGEIFITNDGGDVWEYLYATGGTNTTVKISSSGSSAYTGKMLAVIGGKGFSQFASVTNSAVVGSEMVYTLDRTFLVPVDATSRIGIYSGTLDVVLAGCDLRGDGNNEGASCGWEAFGPSCGTYHIDNDVADTQVAYRDTSTYTAVGYWNYFADNRFVGTNNGPWLFGSELLTGQDLGLALSVHRDNTYSTVRDRDALLSIGEDSLVCFDHITADGAPIGFDQRSSTVGELILYKSLFTRGGSFGGSKAIDTSNTATPSTITQVQGGQFTGFES